MPEQPQAPEQAHAQAQAQSHTLDKAPAGDTHAAKGARKLAGFIVAGVLAGLLLIAGVLYAAPVLTINAFNVTGTQRLTPEQVTEASGLHEGDNLLRISARDAAAGVAALPWADSVTVSRTFPHTVDIEVRERVAVAFVDAPDGPHLIDAQGREFVVETPPPGAVRIVGLSRDDEGAAARGRDMAVAIVAAIPDDVRPTIAEIGVADGFNAILKMHDGRTVEWGANEDNANKALALQTVLKMEGQRWNISNPELVTRV